MKSCHPCECGCGELTDVCERNDRGRNWTKGSPKRYLDGHNLRQFDKPIKYEVDPETGCWNWLLYIRPDGYGQVKYQDTTQLAHRWMYQSYNGVTLADEQYLDHLCRNRRCVNPSHLEVVTFTENIRRGNSVTLTMDVALQIRSEYIPFVITQHFLAGKYNVDRSVVARIVQNRCWLENA